jgi:hypothetical protein
MRGGLDFIKGEIYRNIMQAHAARHTKCHEHVA